MNNWKGHQGDNDRSCYTLITALGRLSINCNLPLMDNRAASLTNLFSLHQDLSYGELLAGQPGAWLVRNICMQSQNFKKDLMLKLKTISRTCFFL